MEKDIINEMQDFIAKYKNKVVNFDDLQEQEKYIYVCVDSFNYFANFLNYKMTMQRTIANADAHKKDDYEIFKNRKIKII